MSSGDELTPTIADFDVPASRCGRKIQPPKALIYQEEQVQDCVLYDIICM